jgi:hypothetical protein
MHDPQVTNRLEERLRRPASASTVPGSLPVLFFGDLFSAQIVTVGLNPSRREYANARNEELDGPDRRFETLSSLGANDRASLTSEQCATAIETMRAYFDPGKPAYSWFASLSRVVQGMGLEYGRREVAHLDLVQEATDPTWSTLNSQSPGEARALLEQDASFLRWQIDVFPLRALVCNGRTVLDQVIGLTLAEVVARDKVGRLTWSVAVGSVGDRPLAVVGWNIPLARPTGLTANGQVELGQRLRTHIEAAMESDSQAVATR